MKKRNLAITASVAAFVAVSALAAGVEGQETAVQSLRGTTSITETEQAPDIKNLSVGDKFSRAYRQQPPLIPHKVSKYQINLKVNQCMRCHDWPYNVEEGAPKISETHYVDRSGAALDKVSPSRWFCNQCHVPQAKARALVPNSFRSAAGN